MTGEHNILDDIFKTPEEDVETFMDVLKDKEVAVTKTNEWDRAVSGRPDERLKEPRLGTHISGHVKIECGWHGSDYVWHLCSVHPKKQFKVSMERVSYSIAKVMNSIIPSSITVNFFLPYADWDIQEYTFKAIDLEHEWSITDEALGKVRVELFEILNTLI